ncbi:hypothetical protein [Mucisphaera calidilacus]|nr:hypothetical protein [Mucisphaera calidilacus]
MIDRVSRVPVLCFGSPVYWEREEALRAACREVVSWLSAEEEGRSSPRPEAVLIREESDLLRWRAERSRRDGMVIFVALSGGVQPLMLKAAEGRDHVVLAHAYLAQGSERFRSLAGELMHRNAHPASTDVYACLRRQRQGVTWASSASEVWDAMIGWQARERMRGARIVMIGETEPWVINSCRSPERARGVFGCDVVPLPLEVLLDRARSVTDEQAREHADDWVGGAQGLVQLDQADVLAASRVYCAMDAILAEHGADGLSIACFSLIGALDTTSCLAVSTFNDRHGRLAACEGDLDAALTMLMLKALGATFVWVANPIIHGARTLDLVHCTAPRCACGGQQPYRLLRHHESGRGVAPEVALPTGRSVTLSRLGDDLSRVALLEGRTHAVDHLPACHTQLRIELDAGQDAIEALLGTHLVMTYGSWAGRIEHFARFAGLETVGSVSVSDVSC